MINHGFIMIKVVISGFYYMQRMTITKTDVFALNFLPFLYCCFNLQNTFYEELQLIKCSESDRRKKIKKFGFGKGG